jgi:arginase
VTVVGAPTSAASFAPGQEQAPRALRSAGLLDALAASGLPAVDAGDTTLTRWSPDRVSPRAQHAERVAQDICEVAERVANSYHDEALTLVLGGNCTVGLGTIKALQSRAGRLGVVYLDLHADLNTPQSIREGAFDWMGIGHALALEGADPRVTGALGSGPLLDRERIVFLGWAAGEATDWERRVIEERALQVVGIEELERDPVAGVGAALAALQGCDAIAVHFDVDLVDFVDAPLAENYVRNYGLSLDRALALLAEALGDQRACALTVTELNPLHGAEDGSTVRRFSTGLVDALVRSAGKTADR